jgi:hypothetical protein
MLNNVEVVRLGLKDKQNNQMSLAQEGSRGGIFGHESLEQTARG